MQVALFFRICPLPYGILHPSTFEAPTISCRINTSRTSTPRSDSPSSRLLQTLSSYLMDA